MRIRVQDAAGNLVLVDAREPSEVLDEITSLGWDIDQGMVVKVGEKLYYAADAIHILSLMATPIGFFNRFNYLIFKNKKLAKFLYPLLRFFRSVLLKILDKKKVNNLGLVDHDRF